MTSSDPDRLRNQDGPRFRSLAETVICPVESLLWRSDHLRPQSLGDPKASTVERQQDRLVRRGIASSAIIRNTSDSSRMRSASFSRKAEAVAEPPHRSSSSLADARRQTATSLPTSCDTPMKVPSRSPKLLGILLKIAEGDPTQWLIDCHKELLCVTTVCTLGMTAADRGATVQSDVDPIRLVEARQGRSSSPESARRLGFQSNAR